MNVFLHNAYYHYSLDTVVPDKFARFVHITIKHDNRT
jgi:hypothetical protein